MINAEESKHCNKCGGILDLKYAMEMEQKLIKESEMMSKSDAIMNLLFKDEDVQKIIMEKMSKMHEKDIISH